MKNKVLFIFLCLLVSTNISAQNGAVVERDQGNWAGYEWNGEDILAVLATDLYFFCGDEVDLVPFDLMLVWRPDGTPKVHESGNLFTRVFQPATPDDFWGPEGDPCPFIESGPLVAEGISYFVYNDNDGFAGHPNRQNVFGYNVTGTLYDMVGSCSDDMVDLTIVRRLKWEKGCDADPDTCIIPRVLKGPELNCQ